MTMHISWEGGIENVVFACLNLRSAEFRADKYMLCMHPFVQPEFQAKHAEMSMAIPLCNLAFKLSMQR